MTLTGEKVTDPAQLGPAGWRVALDWLDLRWPPGNPAALRAMGDAWTACGHALAAGEAEATAAASLVWNAPDGQHRPEGKLVDGFKQWWSSKAADPGAVAGPFSPQVNLREASAAAIKLGLALHGLAAEIAVTRAAWVVKLGSLVAATVAIGAVLFATGPLGGFVLAGAGAGVAAAARKVLVRAVLDAVTRIATRLIKPLLLSALATFTTILAFQRLPEADIDSRPQADLREQPKRVPPPGPAEWWRRNRRPDCGLPPSAQETPRARITGGADPEYAGNRIFRIHRDVMVDGARRITIEGFIGDPIPRQHYERTLPGLAESVGLSPREWQRAHAWPHVWGSETREGILLARKAMNEAQRVVEDQITARYKRLAHPDSWIEMTVTVATFPASEFGGAGANMLHQAEYHATICDARTGEIEQLSVGLEARPDGGVLRYVPD